MSILQDLLSGMRHPHEAEVIPDRGEAIAWALGQARPGDCVLIAGKGHETEQIVGAGGSRSTTARWRGSGFTRINR